MYLGTCKTIYSCIALDLHVASIRIRVQCTVHRVCVHGWMDGWMAGCCWLRRPAGLGTQFGLRSSCTDRHNPSTADYTRFSRNHVGYSWYGPVTAQELYFEPAEVENDVGNDGQLPAANSLLLQNDMCRACEKIIAFDQQIILGLTSGAGMGEAYGLP